MSDGTTTAFAAAEMPNQVVATRGTAGAGGNIFYNTTSLFARSSALLDLLRTGVYSDGAAVPPAATWLDATPPARPVIDVVAGTTSLGVRGWTVRPTAATGETPRWWIVQTRWGGQWHNVRAVFGASASFDVAVPVTVNAGQLDGLTVRAADAVWNLSEPAVWRAPTVVAGP